MQLAWVRWASRRSAGSRCIAVLAVLALSGCGLVPTKFDEVVAGNWARTGFAVYNLKQTCGYPEMETTAKVVLLSVVEYVAIYSDYYGNGFDRAQAGAMKEAVLGFEPGGGATFCSEYAEQLRRRVERVAATINERPRR